MNPVCYLKELSHSLLSGNGNCCFREFGQSTFGVHWRDPEAFCHSCNGSLTVKHAECRKEHLFSSRQVLWISLGYAYKQIDKYFSLPRASEEARSLDNSNGPAPSLKDQFSSPSERPRYDSSATPARRRAANGNLHGRHPGVALRENVGLRITSRPRGGTQGMRWLCLACSAGASSVMVAKVDRLTRSVAFLPGLLEPVLICG
jgi:hypothetical protein